MRIISARLRDERGITLVVILMVMAILLSIIGAGLLFSGINTKISGNYNVGLKAFYAADTGINAGVNQLAADPAVATAAFTKDMGGGLAYRSGHRTDSSPQPLQYKGAKTEAGYSLNMGSGYNTSGYAFYRYQMNVTGTYTTTWGAVVAGRELEAQLTYGPAAR